MALKRRSEAQKPGEVAAPTPEGAVPVAELNLKFEPYVAQTQDVHVEDRDADFENTAFEDAPTQATEPDDMLPERLPMRRRFWEPYRVFWTVSLGALMLALLSVALWFALPVRLVEVQGNAQLSQTEVRRLAGLDTSYPFGWAYYGAWRAGALQDNAWVESARITRIFPDRVSIAIKERVPVAQLRSPGGQMTVLAADGTPLPLTGPQLSAIQQKPLITGWGPERTADALYAVQALARYNVKSVDYSPTGLTVQTDKGSIWSGDRDLFSKYASALEQQSAGKRINLYPWGVSVE